VPISTVFARLVSSPHNLWAFLREGVRVGTEPKVHDAAQCLVVRFGDRLSRRMPGSMRLGQHKSRDLQNIADRANWMHSKT